jgi:hypothetical protein
MSNRLASIFATGVACFLAYSCATGSTDTGDDPLPTEGTGGTSSTAGKGGTSSAGETGSAGQSGGGVSGEAGAGT